MFSSMELSQRLYYRVFVLREALPFLPVREQLESIIRYGNDRADNAVVLTIDGLFELRSCPFTVHDPFIVASFEKFPATGGFIGEEAAKDKKYLDSIYWKAVEFWVRHSITGETNFFSDEFGCKGQNPLYALFA